MNFLILGMPNVGKTSFYNTITLENSNIIHGTIGTTRDWHENYLSTNKNIKIIDTPGIIYKNKKKLDEKINQLIKKIDIFLYVLDYKKENYFEDKETINFYRKFKKEIILIVNKDDNYKQDKDLQFLGISNVFFISCAHKLGVSIFLEFLNQYNSKKIIEEKIDCTLGLYGKTNVGKSTLLNKLVGFDRSLVSNKPKTTTDIVSSNYLFKGSNYLIKDTAGLIKKSKIDKDSLDYFVTKKSISIINKIDVNIFLIDINQGFDNQSKKILNLIFKKSNILLFLINKIDLIKNDIKKIKNLKKDIENEYSQSKNLNILSISAFNKKDIKFLKDYIHKLSYNLKINYSTSQINKWLNKIINLRPHPRINGKEVKFKYGTQISNSPITIKIFSNFSKEIKNDYKRFLINQFYKYFKIKNKKITIIFSKSNNPYN